VDDGSGAIGDDAGAGRAEEEALLSPKYFLFFLVLDAAADVVVDAAADVVVDAVEMIGMGLWVPKIFSPVAPSSTQMESITGTFPFKK